jgi:lipopolysaccharide transport system ATP-binding protein
MASLLEVGTGFHPELTGRENIFLNGAILGMTKKEIQNKFDEIVDFSGCEMYIDTPTKRYSSGMTVRLGFAVAAFLDPEILVVDEVLAVGDAEFQKKAIGKMKEVSEGGGRTVLFVSHNMASVATLCNRGILMENGGIIMDGQVDQVINAYNDSNNKAFETGQLNDPLLRRGNGKMRLMEVKINKNGFYDNERILLELTIKAHADLTEAYASIVLKNPKNDSEIISTIPPFLLGLAINKSQEMVLTVEIKRKFIREANYPLYLWLGNINKDLDIVAENEAYDVVDGLYSLKLKTTKNRLELGYDPNNGYSGYFNLDYNIEIRNV